MVKKIVLYGYDAERNFGYPSLIHGAIALIRDICPNCEIVYVQRKKITKAMEDDLGIKCLTIAKNSTSRLLLALILAKFGIVGSDYKKLYDHIAQSDVVMDLNGICFCSQLRGKNLHFPRNLLSVITTFPCAYLAKNLGKLSVKCPASYGPIIKKDDVIAARYATRKLFDVIYAREMESKKQLNKYASHMNISVVPDLANMMPYVKVKNITAKSVGISVSHQIIKQWKADEQYIKCMTSLIEHIIMKHGLKVVLIPNEYPCNKAYNDISVAYEIKRILHDNSNVEILDVENMQSSAVKNVIASCDIIVASRYHSCVAALSSGVPTLVVGWHYKYYELLELYQQQKWILSEENCSSAELIHMFDKLFGQKETIRTDIEKCVSEVRNSLLDIGRIILS